MAASRGKDPPSLLQRAVAMLARREYSRAELARRLARYLDDEDQTGAVDAVLDRLEAKGMLSNERFARALVRKRGERFGVARVRRELREHAVDPQLIQDSVVALQGTEYERARAVWEKKFGHPARDEAERARQMRFLAARGFANDVILRIVRDRSNQTER